MLITDFKGLSSLCTDIKWFRIFVVLQTKPALVLAHTCFCFICIIESFISLFPFILLSHYPAATENSHCDPMGCMKPGDYYNMGIQEAHQHYAYEPCFIAQCIIAMSSLSLCGWYQNKIYIQGEDELHGPPWWPWGTVH